MKAIDIIKALSAMGDTQDTGVFTTPDAGEIDTYLKDLFGWCATGAYSDAPRLKPNTDYIYCYEGLIGGVVADEALLVGITEIYLYEIE